ncbi:MAG: diacylglycerol kinase [Lentisphaerae bacterium GWF2_57_35]|nr:MAG: diacylglycerol kinase [Lentisphaerae bacterium GWF2_57_35]
MFGRIRSFRYAFHGLLILLQTQHNALATVVAAIAGWHWGISKTDWSWLILTIGSVWAAEAMNTALELLADAVHPAFHPLVGKAKDVAAGAVLITAMGSLIIGLTIFGPHLIYNK